MDCEIRALLEELGVECWKFGVQDFITLTLALYVDMGFMDKGEYDLAAELQGLARARKMPLRWLYAEMRGALLPLMEAPTAKLQELGVKAPPPTGRTVPKMAVALAQWLREYYG